MQILRYVSLSIAGLLAGATAGCIGGLALGWLLSLGCHRHGPSDPGDAPVYVAMGLTAVGACGSDHWIHYRSRVLRPIGTKAQARRRIAEHQRVKSLVLDT